jgi:hypothetical protein
VPTIKKKRERERSKINNLMIHPQTLSKRRIRQTQNKWIRAENNKMKTKIIIQGANETMNWFSEKIKQDWQTINQTNQRKRQKIQTNKNKRQRWRYHSRYHWSAGIKDIPNDIPIN